MLNSMTGFGRGEHFFEGGCVVVEVKSVNHRYLDVFCRVPKRFSSLENQARKTLSARFSRGRFDITAQFDSSREENRVIELNLPLAEEYYSVFQELKEKFNLMDEISLSLFAGVRDMIIAKEMEPDQKDEENAFNVALNSALDSLEQMRETEGENLHRDFLEKLSDVRKRIAGIQSKSPQVLADYRGRLAERVKELNEGIDVDAQRLHQEIAFFAERCDISEELVRITSHLDQFGTQMNANKPVGRKLDFLLQEINREVNTIASKANDAGISQEVVEIKGELEKVREQVQNIE